MPHADVGLRWHVRKAVPMDIMASGRSPLQCLRTVVQEAAHVAMSGRMQAHDSAATLDKVAVWEEDRRVSRYAADLPQLDEGLGRWGRQACPFPPCSLSICHSVCCCV